MYVKGKLHIAEFFYAVVLWSEIFINCTCSVLGGIEDGGDLNDIGSAKRGETFLRACRISRAEA